MSSFDNVSQNDLQFEFDKDTQILKTEFLAKLRKSDCLKQLDEAAAADGLTVYSNAYECLDEMTGTHLTAQMKRATNTVDPDPARLPEDWSGSFQPDEGSFSRAITNWTGSTTDDNAYLVQDGKRTRVLGSTWFSISGQLRDGMTSRAGERLFRLYLELPKGRSLLADETVPHVPGVSPPIEEPSEAGSEGFNTVIGDLNERK